MSCQYHPNDLYCDSTLCSAINIDTQLRPILTLCEVGPWNRESTENTVIITNPGLGNNQNDMIDALVSRSDFKA